MPQTRRQNVPLYRRKRVTWNPWLADINGGIQDLSHLYSNYNNVNGLHVPAWSYYQKVWSTEIVSNSCVTTKVLTMCICNFIFASFFVWSGDALSYIQAELCALRFCVKWPYFLPGGATLHILWHPLCHCIHFSWSCAAKMSCRERMSTSIFIHFAGDYCMRTEHQHGCRCFFFTWHYLKKIMVPVITRGETLKRCGFFRVVPNLPRRVPGWPGLVDSNPNK